MNSKRPTMSSAFDREMNLPLGYKFVPTDAELVEFYLLPKLKGEKLPSDYIMDLDNFFDYEPQQLAAMNKFNHTKDNQLFFFTRELKGHDRTTPNGYWKVYADNVAVVRGSDQVIGYKTKLFHDVYGKPTEWKMTEFRCGIPDVAKDYIVCRIKPMKKEEEEGHVVEIISEDDE